MDDSSGQKSPAGALHADTITEEESLRTRIYTWLSSNGLYVEAAMAIIALAAGAVALPFVTFMRSPLLGVKHRYSLSA